MQVRNNENTALSLPSTMNPRREVYILFPVIFCFAWHLIDSFFHNKLTFSDSWSRFRQKMKAADGTIDMEISLSTLTTEEEYVATRLANIDPLYKNYSRPYIRTWSFGQDCLPRSALDDVIKEVLRGRDGPLTSVEKRDREHKLKAEWCRWALLYLPARSPHHLPTTLTFPVSPSLTPFNFSRPRRKGRKRNGSGRSEAEEVRRPPKSILHCTMCSETGQALRPSHSPHRNLQLVSWGGH